MVLVPACPPFARSAMIGIPSGAKPTRAGSRETEEPNKEKMKRLPPGIEPTMNELVVPDD